MEHNRIKRFNENSELNISDVSENKKEIYNFLLWLRKNHKYRQFEKSGELRFQDVFSDKEYSFDEIYDFYDLTIHNMKDEELEIEKPTGKFILDNLPFEKRFQTANGMYIHYSDVCQLLKKYHESKVKKF